MELTTGIHALAVESELEDRTLTLNPVAVETPKGLLLLDVGLPGEVATLAAALQDEALALGDVWGVVLTHQDADHAGCLAAVVERTGATVFAHEAAAPVVEGEAPPAKGDGDDPGYEPTTVDLRLVGGETFATAAGPMRTVFTPGHTPGHTSYYFPEPSLLVAADALNVADGELVGPRSEMTADEATAWESVEILAALDVERTHCYHGGTVDEGADRIAALLDDR